MATLFLSLLATFALLLTTVMSSLRSGLYLLSRYELKRKAQLREAGARSAYMLRGYGYQMIIGLATVQVVAAVVFVTLMTVLFNDVLAAVLSIVGLILCSEILARFYLRNRILKRLDGMLPYLMKLLNVLKPVSVPLGKRLDKKFKDELPYIYSKDQLVEALEAHQASFYSDIEQQEVEIVRSALAFGDKQIREVMTPKSVVRTINADMEVGPITMNELHATGFSRIPVWQGEQDHFVGTLHVRNLLQKSAKQGGKIKDYMTDEVYFVHEEQPLGHALQAFLRTKHHLFIVVNNFAEFVGIITIEDVIEQIIGKQIVDEFDKYDDMREVAMLRADNKSHILDRKMVK